MKNFLSGLSGVFGVGCIAVAGCASDAGSTTAELKSALSPNLVIAMVFGGGGNTAAPFTHDFVVLFNRGSAAASLNGLSLQYDNANGNFAAASDVLALPNVAVQPGQYFLIQLNSNNPVGAPLPTPDLTGDIGLSNNNGKIALVTAPLDGCGAANDCPTTNIVDLIGYGAASSWEPTGSDAASSAVAALDNTTGASRNAGGCTDTDDNASDFTVGAPAPKNTASPLAPCATTPDAGSDAGSGGSAGSAGAAAGGSAGSSSGGTAGAATGGTAGAATGGAAGAATGGAGGSGGAATGGGGSPSGGSGGSATGGSGAIGGFGGKSGGAPSEDDGGCGCSTPGSNSSGTGLIALLSMTLGIVFRRRR